MKNLRRLTWLFLFCIFCIISTGCNPHRQSLNRKEPLIELETQQAPVSNSQTTEPDNAPAPGVEDETGYLIKPFEIEIKSGRPYIPVGAELVTQEGKVQLHQVIKQLANLKGFSVSWADDVDLTQLVDVDIRPEENYWDALDNILRQLDYFYDITDETIIVMYKETKEYRLVMPYINENFKTGVGGNLLGGTQSEGKMKGEVMMEGSMKEPLDVWMMIENNLNRIIQLSSGEQKAAKDAKTGAGQGYLIIDRHLGIITVTAPRKTQERVKEYLESVDRQIHKQVIIEAKIIEVRLNNSSEMGINWEKVLNTTISGVASFGKKGVIYPFPHKDGFISKVELKDNDFSVMLKALNEQGTTNILSNPKISILNGHGATITVGENVTYIDKVETKETGGTTTTTTFTINTGTVLSGVGLAVMANILDNEEVILYIVPVTSELEEPIEYRQFTGAGTEAEVGLPRVRLKEMATYAKIKNGQTLIVGGLIDSIQNDSEKGTPFLEDIPLIGRLFKVSSKEVIKRELVILLKPKIVGSS